MKKYLGVLIILFLLLLKTTSAKDSVDSDYRICANDLLEISVYEEPDLAKTVRVDAKGAISYPLLGNIEVEGLTAKELETKITELLAMDYLVSPQVSVFIKEYAKISVLGQVRNPGAYELKSNLTVMDAIALAGGLNEKSNAKDIKLVRIKGGEKETINMNAEEIVGRGNKEMDIRLKPGDLIIVNELSELSSFVVVLGQVKSPGRYPYKDGMTSIEAIALAGGLTPIAAPNGTKLIRTKDGKKVNIRIPVNVILDGKAKDVPLEPEDTITVPESFF